MNKPIAILLIATILTLAIATGALSLSACATTNNQESPILATAMSALAQDSKGSSSEGDIRSMSFTLNAGGYGVKNIHALEKIPSGSKPPVKISKQPLVHNINTGEDFETIQAAIAAPNTTNGHTITVDPGTYTETVEVYKSLTLRSTSGNPADTIVQAADTGGQVFTVTVNYVNISGFYVTGDASARGFYLDGAHHCCISGNTVTAGATGFYLDGADHCCISGNTASSFLCFYLSSSSHNVLYNNTADRGGFYLSYSSGNVFYNNTASRSHYSIRLSYSSGNVLYNNTASSNDYGIYLSSSDNNVLSYNHLSSNDHNIFLSSSDNNVLTNNTALHTHSGYYGSIHLASSNNNMLYNNDAFYSDGVGIYLDSSSDNELTNNTASFNYDTGICLDSSTNNVLTNNTANSNGLWYYSSHNNNKTKLFKGVGIGIYLSSSSYNMLDGNTVKSNPFGGIHLFSSSNNALSGNNILSNGYYDNYGIYISSSSSNSIYNNYFDNTNNAYDDGNNIWNKSKEYTPNGNIIGGPYLGGNYWSDYAGEDTTGDGLGDTLLPYNSSGEIQNGGDLRPLVPAGFAPPEITSFAPLSPVNDTRNATRTFNITINQSVNVSWQINGTEVQTNEGVTEASYTNTSAVIGTWNVSVIVNNANGTDMQTWIWTVTSPCFIATAAYGTPLHEDIDVLRDFRDEYLMTNPTGRAFVMIYYNVSPPIADLIRVDEGLGTAVREGFVKPLVYVTRMFVG